MRGLIDRRPRAPAAPALVASVALSLLACGCRPTLPPVEGPLVELFHYEGRPNEKPVIPGLQLETLVRFEPKLPAYRLRRLRFLLGQPGRIVFHIYRALPGGGPGPLIAEIEPRPRVEPPVKGKGKARPARPAR